MISGLENVFFSQWLTLKRQMSSQSDLPNGLAAKQDNSIGNHRLKAVEFKIEITVCVKECVPCNVFLFVKFSLYHFRSFSISIKFGHSHLEIEFA